MTDDYCLMLECPDCDYDNLLCETCDGIGEVVPGDSDLRNRVTELEARVARLEAP